jgi:hypothetical protein
MGCLLFLYININAISIYEEHSSFSSYCVDLHLFAASSFILYFIEYRKYDVWIGIRPIYRHPEVRVRAKAN